jgi:hypothetical protein
MQQKINYDQPEERNKNKTWTTFTYYSPKIRKYTNLIKHKNVGLTFEYTSTLLQLTKQSKKKKQQWNLQNYVQHLPEIMYWTDKSSIKQRFQEHTRYIKQNEPLSAYALHILNNKHEYGPIQGTMTLLKHIENLPLPVAYPGFFFGGGSTISVVVRGQRGRISGALDP